MNDVIKCGMFLFAGIAIGAIGAVAVSRGKLDLKPMVEDLISRGIDVKDALLGKFEALKEDLEDVTAAARQRSDERKAENAAE